jgi:hypothetical protein
MRGGQRSIVYSAHTRRILEIDYKYCHREIARLVVLFLANRYTVRYYTAYIGDTSNHEQGYAIHHSQRRRYFWLQGPLSFPYKLKHPRYITIRPSQLITGDEIMPRNASTQSLELNLIYFSSLSPILFTHLTLFEIH